MNYLQEVRIETSKDIVFTCHIISTNNSAPFGAEVLIYDPRINTIFSSLHTIGSFNSAQDAYSEIIAFCQKYSGIAGVSINKIDNPCNAPFIDKQAQQSIVNKKGVSSATVLVNGQ
jgi:hypothetical protein